MSARAISLVVERRSPKPLVVVRFLHRPQNMNIVYHASKIQGLKHIEPRISTHGHEWVYATKKKEESVMYLGIGYDLIIATGSYNGQLGIIERFEGALDYAYLNQKGSIYKLDGVSFKEDLTSYTLEVVADGPQFVLDEEKIENALDLILQLELEEKIKIYRYPDLPEYIPADKSDLIEKYKNAKDSLIRRGKWEGVLFDMKKFHPEIAVNFLD